jgi:DNA-3-methyladenine glycosylase II
MFHLNRPDILPIGDRETFKRLYNLEERRDSAQMEEISQPWRPYRTLESRYLWRALNTPSKGK